MFTNYEIRDNGKNKVEVIVNEVSGAFLGVYSGESAEEALDEYARDAGYRDMEHADEVTGGNDLRVIPVEEVDARW